MPTSHLVGLQMQLCVKDVVRQEELKIMIQAICDYCFGKPSVFSLFTTKLKLFTNFKSVYIRNVASASTWCHPVSSPFHYCSLNYQLKFCFMHLISNRTMGFFPACVHVVEWRKKKEYPLYFLLWLCSAHRDSLINKQQQQQQQNWRLWSLIKKNRKFKMCTNGNLHSGEGLL